MSSKARKAAAWLLAMGMFVFSGTALATNGYFTHGVGTDSKAMAGTGIGSSENLGAIGAASNPALSVFSDDKWQVGFAIFSPDRSYTTSSSLANGNGGAFTLGAGKFSSKNDAFPIPYVAKNWSLANDRDLTFVFYGRGGMNTEWDGGQTAMLDPTGQGGAPATLPGAFGGGKAGVNLMQAFASLNYAGKVNDNFAWGIGPVVAVQFFEATGLVMFSGFTQTFADAVLVNGMGAPVPGLTNNGHDTSVGYGLSAGIWAGLSDTFSVGFAYQTKMSMGELDDYRDLYAEAGGFDIPSTIKAGASIKASEAITINVDIEQIGYSDVDSVHNPIMNMLTGCFTANPMVAPETSGCLGGPNGAGFGWDDMTVYKLGLAWATDENNTWRFGYSTGDQPIPSSEVLFNILAPGVMEEHITIGWTRKLASGSIFSTSLMYAPSNKVTGTNTFDPTQSIQLEMSQLEIEFAYRF